MVNFCSAVATETHDDVYHACVGEYIANSKQYVSTMYSYMSLCIHEEQIDYDLDDTDDAFLDILSYCIEYFVAACFTSDDIDIEACLDSPYDMCLQLTQDMELQCNKSISFIITDSLETSLCLSDVESCVSSY